MITAIVGYIARNDLSYSSASATTIPPSPTIACDPTLRSIPPTRTVGDIFASVNTVPIRDVVVVFPCVPATHTVKFDRIISPSTSALLISGMPLSTAYRLSGLSSLTALEYTSSSASLTKFGSGPYCTFIPSVSKRRDASETARSLPVTVCPRDRNTSAKGLIPAPPIPTMCIFFVNGLMFSAPFVSASRAHQQKRCPFLYGSIC
ncbi:hypothetical protein R80B4_02434 [Fibrobacteres bacterium R8-0-B4]